MRVVRFKHYFVGPHQEALADRGTGLQVPQIGGPLLEAEMPHAGADGPGADQDDLSARLTDALDLVGQGLDAPDRDAARAGEHVGAHLDDDGSARAMTS